MKPAQKKRSHNKKPVNWRVRNEITAEVQADLRKKGITINSKLPLKFRPFAFLGENETETPPSGNQTDQGDRHSRLYALHGSPERRH